MTYFQGGAFVYLLAAAVFLYHTEHKGSPVLQHQQTILCVTKVLVQIGVIFGAWQGLDKCTWA